MIIEYLPRPKSDRAPKSHRPATAYHRRMMKCDQVEGAIIETEKIEHFQEPEFPRVKTGKTWRKEDLAHKIRDKDLSAEMGVKGLPVQYRRECERTDQALLEWENDIEKPEEVSPWELLEVENQRAMEKASSEFYYWRG